MKVLIVGDVIGKPGRKILQEYLERKKDNYDFIIINGENTAAGFGITEKIAKSFFEWGVDVITSGNHIWDKKEIYDYLEKENSLLRPLNYPAGVPGSGYVIKEAKNGTKIAVVNLQGRVFMPAIDCPFQCIEKELKYLQEEADIIIVDFHAEATSEKMALGWYLDGKASAVYGTHTHIQTSDSRILNEGTAYITDIGMTGAHDGIIGMTVESILPKFLTALPQKFNICENNVRLNGIEIEFEGKIVVEINRLDLSIEELDFY